MCVWPYALRDVYDVTSDTSEKVVSHLQRGDLEFNGPLILITVDLDPPRHNYENNSACVHAPQNKTNISMHIDLIVPYNHEPC